MITTIICYAAVIALPFLAITTIPLILGAHGGMVGVLAMACVVWAGISYLWFLVEGGVMPVAAYAGAFVILFIQKWDNLIDAAKMNVAAEQWGILIVASYQMYLAHQIRWF